ncbi:MAG: hypothetical protein JSU87_15445 [Gemmatimonadota bacterium]|nr:MAG: hypothetical protein JSU87_15445 [Gemmatimonadota bacterium]
MAGETTKSTGTKSQAARPFHSCGSCDKQWPTWEAFVLDAGIRLLGLQAVEQLPDANLLVFEHRCGSSVSLKASQLRPYLLPDPEAGIALPKLFGTEECTGHCRLVADLSACERPCINAHDRRLIARVIELRRAAR